MTKRPTGEIAPRSRRPEGQRLDLHVGQCWRCRAPSSAVDHEPGQRPRRSQRSAPQRRATPDVGDDGAKELGVDEDDGPAMGAVGEAWWRAMSPLAFRPARPRTMRGLCGQLPTIRLRWREYSPHSEPETRILFQGREHGPSNLDEGRRAACRDAALRDSESLRRPLRRRP